MNNREVAKFVCKVLSIYFFVCALGDIPVFATTLGAMGSFIPKGHLSSALISIGAAFLLSLLVGIVLWSRSDAIAAHLAKGCEEETASTRARISSNDYLLMAFAVIGMYLAAVTTPELFHSAVYCLSKQAGSRSCTVSLCSELIRFVIATILIVRSRALLVLGGRSLDHSDQLGTVGDAGNDR